MATAAGFEVDADPALCAAIQVVYVVIVHFTDTISQKTCDNSHGVQTYVTRLKTVVIETFCKSLRLLQ